MRPSFLFAIVLQSCAIAPSSASSPVVAASAPSHVIATDDGNCDLACQAEVLSGFELELGDERAKTAASNARGNALEKKIIELQDVARSLQAHALYGPLIAGAVGVVVGGLLAVLGVAASVLRVAVPQ